MAYPLTSNWSRKRTEAWRRVESLRHEHAIARLNEQRLASEVQLAEVLLEEAGGNVEADCNIYEYREGS